MTAAILTLALSLTLVAAAIYFWSQATLARGRAEAFQQVADDFRGLAHVSWWRKDKERRREQKKLWLRLSLCSPEVRDALRDALSEADEYWAKQ